MLHKFSMASHRRLKVSQSQNSLDKSATPSRAWPLPVAFLIPQALLGVADFNLKANKSVWLYLVIILCVAGGTTAPAIAQAGGTVAVWDLEDLTPMPSTAADMGEILSAKIIETFKESGDYRVVERQRLLLVLEELNLGTTELISESTRLEIGRLIGARLMVFGSYMVINDIMRMDLRKVEVETGLILKAISKTASGFDIVEWLKITREAAKELL